MAKERKPYYEVYQGTDEKWRWRQVAVNGVKTAAQGNPSASKRLAVEAVITHARIAAELVHDYDWHGDFQETDTSIAQTLRANDAIRIR